jgi:2-isopropylmalate synthase
VTIQVLTQAREELIRPTFEALRGARARHRPPVQLDLRGAASAGLPARPERHRRDRLSRCGADPSARRAARRPGVVYEYSPESFTGTELDFAVEIVEAVMAVLGADAGAAHDREPAGHGGDVDAERLRRPHRVVRPARSRARADVLSVHPHNDRGTAVAAAELAVMAGAERVEGTLFGNGERTGNVDLVTLALNLLTQGVDPGLDLRDVNALVRLAEECTQLPVHPRHPYAGELVFTAFSGSHQDAIRKGLAARDTAVDLVWEVPYLPMDPGHVGRGYDELIRVNSQSGKGGVAFVLERDHGVQLPRRMQIEFQRVVQRAAEESGGEVDSAAIGILFEATYLAEAGPLALARDGWQVESSPGGRWRVRARVVRAGEVDDAVELDGVGNGPIDAFFAALAKAFAPGLRLSDFREHALGEGSDARALACVEVIDATGRSWHGAGRDPSTVAAALRAVLSATNRALSEAGQGGAPQRP